ncbi:MAG: DEAD/DEAH box helicase [Caldilineae bacterium]|nr:MAG: DEAD/DEAH box helicase [Caldilineae bacterium]
MTASETLSQRLAGWQTDPRFMAQVAVWRTLPATPPRFADWPPALDGRVVEASRQQGIARPYHHQAQAIEAALSGKHVVMVTGTASGKTLGYNAPVLHTLLNDPAARALYLFPTKALAQDQQVAFNRLAEAIGAAAPRAATYDGDTPQAARRTIRRGTRVLISNPDMLHAGILPHHPRWRTFFAALRYVVIDEMHTYRGVFGSHFANVLRRLQRICAFYGADPQFIGASATIANPYEHALLLLDLAEPHRLHIIAEDGSPRARKHILFYNPPIVDEQLGLRRGLLLTANRLARQILETGAQTVVFARSRLKVEVLLTYLRDFARERGFPAESVRGYRGGYLPAARRAIEAGLRDGSVRGVVATNALELGVDIGGLSACLLAGYPGTIASTWQQMGRAGRREGESVAVLVGGQDPLDQFLMAHPHFFFDRSPEHARLDPDNPMIALSHLLCAAYELPFGAEEPFGLFPNPAELLDLLVQEGQLRRSAGRYHWLGEGYPAGEVNLRATGAHNVAITVTGEGGEVETIGEVDIASAPLLVYPGAIYLHEGESYQITMLDLEGGRAEATPVAVGYYTQPHLQTEIEILRTDEQDAAPRLERARGAVRVVSQVTGFKQVRRYTHETLGYVELDLPPQSFETTACWFTLPDAALEALREAGVWHRDALDYGPPALWQQQRDAARARDGYRCRRCGAPEPPHRQHDVHHLRPLRLFLEEAARNGVETSQAYRRAHDLANLMTLCPACHRRAEVIVRTANAWGGLAHALHTLAPLFLMCDPHDVGVSVESIPDARTRPTITLYDTIPFGLGFAERLYDLHADLFAAALSLTRDCTCRRGCPACVGPPPPDGANLRRETETLLAVLLD